MNDRSVIAIERGDFALARALLDEAEGSSENLSSGIWGNRAFSYLLEGRPDDARPWLVRELQGAHEAGFGVSILIGLLGFAALAARDDPERAAVLCGAVEALRERLQYRIQRLELKVITDTREALASRLGDRFYELTTGGAELELDDAVSLALSS